MVDKLDISFLEYRYREVIGTIFAENPVPWFEIESLFKELAYRLDGLFVPAGAGGQTIIMLRGIIKTFDYPHLSNPPITRIRSVKKFLAEIGIDP